MSERNWIKLYRVTSQPILWCVTILLLVSLACSLPGSIGKTLPSPTPTSFITPTPMEPTPTPQPLPPALVEVVPPSGSILSSGGEISLYFNQSMDRASVESALETGTALEQIKWKDDATLVLKPLMGLSPASPITLIINSQARSLHGMELTESVTLEYTTAGYVRLVQKLPAPDASDVDALSAVVASFNHPMVPLGTDPNVLSPAFTINPAGENPAEGRGEWLNTSTFIFYPEPALQGGKTYQVMPNPDLKSVDGGPLENSEPWTFTVAKAYLVEVSPAENDNLVHLDIPIRLTFSQPMQIASLEAAFRLLDPNSSPVAGSYAWDETTNTLVFTPKNLLKRSTTYTIQLSEDAKALGGIPLESSFKTQFKTTGKLAIISSDPEPGGTKKDFASVRLNLTAPIDIGTFKNLIMISPSLAEMDVWFDEQDTALVISGIFEPDTSYAVVLDADLVDRWGDKLGEEFILEFKTAPLDPALYLTTFSDVLFVTPRDTYLSVQAVNLPKVPLSLGSLPLLDFFVMMGPNGYQIRQGYRAPDQRDWQQPLELSGGAIQPVELYLTPERTALAPGLYYLKFNLDDTRIYSGPFLLVSSHVHLTFKLSPTEVFVWAVDLRTNTQLVNATVTIFNDQGDVLAVGQTNSDGVFRDDIPVQDDSYANLYAVIGQPGLENFALTTANWSQGVSGWDFGIPTAFEPPQVEAYIYTDRPIYRPGQTVLFKTILRQSYNGRYQIPDITQFSGAVNMDIYGDLGQKLTSINLPLSSYATAHGEFNLPEDSAPGYYRLESTNASGGISFQVAEYRKPEINLDINFPVQGIRAGEKVIAQVEASYFFDAPADNLAIHWALYGREAYFSFPGYQVGLVDTSWLDAYSLPDFGFGFGELIREGEKLTSVDGKLEIEIDIPVSSTITHYTLEVTTWDESGVPVSARRSIFGHPAGYYIGIRPDRWVASAGQEIGFDIQLVDWDAQPTSGGLLKASFEQVIWLRQDTSVGNLLDSPKYIPQYTRVAGADLQTNEQGQARLAFTPPSPGTYQLSVSGDGARSELLLWVGGAGQAVWPNLPNQRLHLSSDRSSYQPGDSAEIFIPNPFGAPALALVTLERSVVLSNQVIWLEAEGGILNLALSDEESPNVYLAVTLLGKNKKEQPDFRQGFLNIPVEPREHTLIVNLVSQPTLAAPGDDVEFEIQVSDSTGKPVQGEFSLSLVDKAVLALADPNAPDILKAFYGDQPLGVQTGFSLALYANRILITPPGLGGGGGDIQPSIVRERFLDTAYWNAEIVTDSEGHATIVTILPDNLTTWQVDVRGTNSNTQVGQAKTEVVVSKELLVRPVVPRFLVAGDHVEIAAIIHNNSNNTIEGKVILTTEGFILDDPTLAEQVLILPKNGRERITWWGVAQNIPAVDLLFTAQMGLYEDVTRPAMGKIPVLQYRYPQAYGTTGILDEAGQRLEIVSLPRSVEILSSGILGEENLQVEISPSLAGVIISGLEAVHEFEYESTEQITSRFLATLDVMKLSRKYKFDSQGIQQNWDIQLSDDLTRLIMRQNIDGGFGWWQGGQSDPYITAYTLFGLLRGLEAGLMSSPEALQKAAVYLQSGLVSAQMIHEYWLLDRLAFIQFVLADGGVGDLASLQALYENKAKLNPWALAFIGLALEKMEPGNMMTKTIMSDLSASAIRSSSGAHWEQPYLHLGNMHTTLSGSAVIAFALAQYDPTSPMLVDATRYLAYHRKAMGGWDSSFSSAWSVVALVKVIDTTGEIEQGFDFSASLNGVPLVSGQAVAGGYIQPVTTQVKLDQLYRDEPNALLLERQSGPGRLYYRALLNVFLPVSEIGEEHDGINLSRTYTKVGDAACDQGNCEQINASPSGELVRVRLTLTVENDLFYLMVEDYFPAGCEVLDMSLKTSQQAFETDEKQSYFDPKQPFANGWGWWYFNQPQIYDERISWSTEYLPAGTYELTYTLMAIQRGEFQVLPARAWQLYFLDVRGNSAGMVFTVR